MRLKSAVHSFAARRKPGFALLLIMTLLTPALTGGSRAVLPTAEESTPASGPGEQCHRRPGL